MDDDYWDTDAAFSKALRQGWIRVGINLMSFEFFANFDRTKVSRAALVDLIRVLNTHHAETYTVDDGNAVQTTSSDKEAKAIVNKSMREIGR
jgi:hypothetical protein